MTHNKLLGVFVPVRTTFLIFVFANLFTGCAMRLSESEIINISIYSKPAPGIYDLRQCQSRNSSGKINMRGEDGITRQGYFCLKGELNYSFDSWAYLHVPLSGKASVCKGMVPYALDRPDEGYFEHGWTVSDCYEADLLEANY